MKRFNKIVFLVFGLFMLSGCGQTGNTLNCSYTKQEGDLTALTEIVFERDPETQEIASGAIVMSYVIDKENLSKDKLKEVTEYVEPMFENICGTLESVYEDCNVVEEDGNKKAVMYFNLDTMESMSGGIFKKDMSLNQLRAYMISTNLENNDMTCVIE